MPNPIYKKYVYYIDLQVVKNITHIFLYGKLTVIVVTS